MSQFIIKDFDGPLDLLLSLIEKEKLEICEFSLSKITDQYLEYINKNSINIDEISDYIYISSKLIKIKSNYMLNIYKDDEDEIELIYSLEEYLKYKKFAKKIKNLYDIAYPYLEKIPDEILGNTTFELDEITLDLLPVNVLKKDMTFTNKVYVSKNKKTVNEKILYIKKIYGLYDEMYFSDVLCNNSKEEYVVSMLGALQLSKDKYFILEQSYNFGIIKMKGWFMEFKEKCSTLESYLFLNSTLVSIDELTDIFKKIDCLIKKNDIEQMLIFLNNKYKNIESGLELIKIDEKFQLVSKKDNYTILSKMVSVTKKKNITSSSMETLTIIAYNQPVTKSFIEKIKGTKADATLNTLLKYELIEVKGQLNKLGNPNLYVTTPKFLKHLGLQTLDDLPDYSYFKNTQTNKKI